MPGCQCSGSSCSCLIEAGAGTTVQGTGSKDRPYVISATPVFYSESGITGSTYVIGQSPELGTQSFLMLDFSSTTVLIRLPGDGGVAPPPLGSSLYLRINGLPSLAPTFSGSVTPVGPQPGSNKRGMYHFLLGEDSSGPRWFMSYLAG